MNYLDILLTGTGLVLSLYYGSFNLFKRARFAVNRLFALLCLAVSLVYVMQMIKILGPTPEWNTLVNRGFWGLLLLVIQLSFHLAQIFPRWEKGTPLWIVLLTGIPGAALLGITVFTDLVIGDVTVQNYLQYKWGDLAYVYFSTLGLYYLGADGILLYKSKYLRNESFANQIFFLFTGYNIIVIFFVTLAIILPNLFSVHAYKYVSLALSGSIFLAFVNHAVADERNVDFRQYYIRKTYWLVILTLLTMPSYYFLVYARSLQGTGQNVPAVAVAIILFLYLFLFYRFFRPVIERFFRRGYLEFERNVNEFFKEITQLGDSEGQGQYWDLFFEKTIQNLEPRFGVTQAAFYLFNADERSYGYSYGYGGRMEIEDAGEESDLVGCLREYGRVIDISLFFTDDRLQGYRDKLLDILKNAEIRVLLPFFNPEKVMIGFLLLGRLKNRRQYSTDLLSVLEVYRIQFELSLSNSIMLEEVKATQVVKHDKMVITGVKKRLIPGELKSISGMRISSFYVNNSEHGGDYFDSHVLENRSLGIFMCDVADHGIDSALLLLQLYTVLHTQPEKYDSPEKMLNAMNWVLASSRFTDKYAQALYFTYSPAQGELRYSSAAFNPLTFYDPERENFIELDTKGIPIGIEKNFSYEVKSFKAGKSCVGFLYSDGVSSAVNEEGISYTPGRIKDIIRLNLEDTPAVLTRKIYSDFSAYTKGVKLQNDATLIVFKTE